jgi:hypothetical protein
MDPTDIERCAYCGDPACAREDHADAALREAVFEFAEAIGEYGEVAALNALAEVEP